MAGWSPPPLPPWLRKKTRVKEVDEEEEDAEPLGTEAVELLPPSSEADDSDLGADAKLEDESRTTGRVQGSVIRKYLRSFGHGLFGGSCVITLLAWGVWAL